MQEAVFDLLSKGKSPNKGTELSSRCQELKASKLSKPKFQPKKPDPVASDPQSKYQMLLNQRYKRQGTAKGKKKANVQCQIGGSSPRQGLFDSARQSKEKKKVGGESSASGVAMANRYYTPEDAAVLKNEEMHKKTEKVHQEFEQLMAQLMEKRSKKAGAAGADIEMIDPYYMVEREPRHRSPTMRLIEQMNTAVLHKQVFREEAMAGKADPAYHQIYTTEPGSSYKVQPEGGELPYELAEDDPDQFFEALLSQEIHKQSLRETDARISGRQRDRMGEADRLRQIQSTRGKRPLLNSLETVKEKLHYKLCTRMGGQFHAQIRQALESADIEAEIMELLQNQRITFSPYASIFEENSAGKGRQMFESISEVQRVTEHSFKAKTAGRRKQPDKELNRSRSVVLLDDSVPLQQPE